MRQVVRDFQINVVRRNWGLPRPTDVYDFGQFGLRKFRFHDLRHTFGSLLIQVGVPPAYVQRQMGHRSIQITIDVYGHLIPGENVAWIDTLDKTSQKVTATDAHQPHTQSRESEEEILEAVESIEAEEVIWLPPRDSNPDMLIQSQLSCR